MGVMPTALATLRMVTPSAPSLSRRRRAARAIFCVVVAAMSTLYTILGLQRIQTPVRMTRRDLVSIPAPIAGCPIFARFWQMWDTTALPPNLHRDPLLHPGALRSHQRTWAENEGRSPPKPSVKDSPMSDG